MKRFLARPLLAAVVVFAAACSDDGITAPGATVASVTVQAPVTLLFESDTLTLRAVVRDAEGNELTGHAVTWASSDPTILAVGVDGTAIARRPGSVTVTASVEGRFAAVTMEVRGLTPDPTRYELRSVDGHGLPLTLDSAQVTWNGVPEVHVVRMEEGGFELQGSPLRYRLALRIREYRVVTGEAGSTLEPVLAWTEGDQGLATWGTGGSLSLVSEVVYPLSHLGHRYGPSLQLDYRIPGDDTHLQLGFHQES